MSCKTLSRPQRGADHELGSRDRSLFRHSVSLRRGWDGDGEPCQVHSDLLYSHFLSNLYAIFLLYRRSFFLKSFSWKLSSHYLYPSFTHPISLCGLFLCGSLLLFILFHSHFFIYPPLSRSMVAAGCSQLYHNVTENWPPHGRIG